jgi:U3 small nucleolar RNA-associated protein 21
MKDRPPRSASATSLAISACGNFALVGTLGGVVYKYNLQSGLPRGSFPRDATSSRRGGATAQEGSQVRG